MGALRERYCVLDARLQRSDELDTCSSFVRWLVRSRGYTLVSKIDVSNASNESTTTLRVSAHGAQELWLYMTPQGGLYVQTEDPISCPRRKILPVKRIQGN